MVAAIAYVLNVRIVDDGGIHATNSGVIGKVGTLPAAAVKPASAVPEAVVHAAIEAHGRTPIADIERVNSV
jgi:hypothetical protein